MVLECKQLPYAKSYLLEPMLYGLELTMCTYIYSILMWFYVAPPP